MNNYRKLYIVQRNTPLIGDIQFRNLKDYVMKDKKILM